MDKDPKQIVEEFLEKQESQIEIGRDALMPRKIGQQVLELLKAGKPLSIDGLCTALSTAAQAADQHEAALAKHALERLRSITGGSS